MCYWGRHVALPPKDKASRRPVRLRIFGAHTALGSARALRSPPWCDRCCLSLIQTSSQSTPLPGLGVIALLMICLRLALVCFQKWAPINTYFSLFILSSPLRQTDDWHGNLDGTRLISSSSLLSLPLSKHTLDGEQATGLA